MPEQNLPMYRSTGYECWSHCPERELRIRQAEEQMNQINGDPSTSGGVALLEETRIECETGPVLFMGEIVCGANIDPKCLA